METLRRAVAADALAIRELTRAAYARGVPLIGREPRPMTADYDEAVARHRFDLLYIEGALAALIETLAEADHLLVENVAVSPRFQGRGLGRKLMAHAESIATSSGFREIRLYTNNSSPRTSSSISISATGSTARNNPRSASRPV